MLISLKTSSMLLAAAAALSACLVGADGDCSDSSSPGSKDKFRDVLSVSKLQAPTSEDNEFDLRLRCYHSPDFNLQTWDMWDIPVDETFMRFTQTLVDGRSELRIPVFPDTSVGYFRGDTDTVQRFYGRFRLPATDTEDEDDRYTFMQLHQNKGNPRVRLYTRSNKDGKKDYLWAAIRKGSDDEDPEHVPITPRPNGFFFAEIKLERSQLYIKLSTAPPISRTVSWTDLQCYFKAGSYVQEGPPKKYFVDISALTYTGSFSTLQD
eukprot:jgi/Ulvmu1/11036/UM007_0217.1